MGSAWRREGSREEPTQHIASERETAPQNLQRDERGHPRAVQEQLSGSSEDRAAELSHSAALIPTEEPRATPHTGRCEGI